MTERQAGRMVAIEADRPAAPREVALHRSARPATPAAEIAGAVGASLQEIVDAAVPYAGGGGSLEVEATVDRTEADGSKTAARITVRFRRDR